MTGEEMAAEEAAAADAEMPPMDTEEAAAEGAEGAEENGTKEGEEAVEEVPKEEEEKYEETEVDAPDDKRAKLKESVVMGTNDSTINVAPSCGGKVLTALSDGGFQYLLAGARANAGVKSGRYFYEARIVESRNPMDPAKQQGQRIPRQVCSLGFTTPGSSLFLGDGEEGVGFDSEGNFLSGKDRSRVSNKFETYVQVLGIMVNLDKESPNANTISLFCDGQRACPPKPIPECLKGKVLYPTVNYKNMTLHLNFGPCVMNPLPFKCRTIQEAATADVVITKAKGPKEKCEAVFPVGLPDEGTFDWLDDWLKKNPGYTELSSRAILEWGIKSGLWRQRGSSRSCNDRPIMEFGIRELDDDTIQQMIMSVAPVLKRNYVIMEVRQNLVKENRKTLLDHFDPAEYKRRAIVAIGEPPEAYKEKMREVALQDKKQRAVAEVRRKRNEDGRRRPPPPPVVREPPKEGGEEAKEEEPKKEEPKEPEETLEEAIKKAEEGAELTEEEKERWFRKSSVEDLTQKDLSLNFNNFTMPTQDEGFDEVKFMWQDRSACEAYMKTWTSGMKLTQRVEDLQPGQWFKEQFAEWTRVLGEWRRKHSEWRDNPARKWEAEKKAKAFEPRAFGNEEGRGDKPMEVDGEGGEPAEGEAAKEEEKDGAAEAKEESKIEELDVFSFDDVCDIGNGEPLYANFGWEDWMLLSLRFEIHLMVHSYSKDINDPERVSFHENHLGFYYNKYYRKQFNLRYYGVNTEHELLQIVKDTVEVEKNCILDPQLSDDTPFDNFVRLTEDHRRERQRKIDSGDDSAALKLEIPPPRGQPSGQQPGRNAYQRGPPPPAPQARGMPPGGRPGPPPGPSRYDSWGGGDRYGQGPPRGGYGPRDGYGHRDGGYGPRDGRGGPPPGRYGGGGPPPYPSRGGGYGPPGGAYGQQKRSYPPPPSGGGGYPPYKQSRGPGGYPGGGSYGAGGGGYRR